MLKKNFAVLGGDARQFSLIEYLLTRGACVRAYGLPQEKLVFGAIGCADMQEALSATDVVLLPLPVSPDGRRLHMPLAEGGEAPLLRELFSAVPRSTLLAGGRFSPSVRAMAEDAGHVLFDYAKSEEFEQRNAIPTAEGAVAILMERMKRTVADLPVAVTGYGRVGRALSRLLGAMGAKVTVGARKPAALAEAAGAGHYIRRLEGADSVALLAQGKAAVFNTVPHWLFTKEVLRDIPKETLLIDLASAPGGVDTDAANALGHTVIWALSLPGKYAPESAGQIIADTVILHMEEEGLL